MIPSASVDILAERCGLVLKAAEQLGQADAWVGYADAKMMAQFADEMSSGLVVIDRAGAPTAVMDVVSGHAADLIVTDIVYWPLDDPHKFKTIFDHAAMLGDWNIDDPATYFAGQALEIYDTPLEWLQADCCGIVPIDMRRTAWRLIESSPGSISGENTARWCVRSPARAYELRAEIDAIVDVGRIRVAKQR